MAGLGWSWLAWNHSGGIAPANGARPALELPVTLVVGLVLPPVLVVGVLRMATEVTPGMCRVWFGFLPTYRRAIPLDQLRAVEIVRYRVPRDYLFWGARTARDGETVLTAKGDRAVRLVFADGSRILIGTQRPEELSESLKAARTPTA